MLRLIELLFAPFRRDSRSAYDEATALPPIVYRDYSHMPDRKAARERFEACWAARVDHEDHERRQVLGQRAKDRFRLAPMQYRYLPPRGATLGQIEDELTRLREKGYNAALFYYSGGWVKPGYGERIAALISRDHEVVIPFAKRNQQ